MQGIGRGGGALVLPCLCPHSKRRACQAGQRLAFLLGGLDLQVACRVVLADLLVVPGTFINGKLTLNSCESDLNKYRLSGVPLLFDQYRVHGVGPVPFLEPWSTKEKVRGLRAMVVSSNSSMIVTVAACDCPCW